MTHSNWLRHIIDRVRRKLPRRALVLMYHRVADAASDPWGLCVSPSHFAEHLEVLKDRGTCCRLEDLARSVREGKPPRRAIALTFDDGYADNYHNAKPLLEQYDVPATFFLTTGHLESRREFWWDELGRLLLQPGTLPERVQLTLEGKEYTHSLGEDACYSEETGRRYSSWRAWDEPPSKRHSLYRSLWEELYELPEEKKRDVLSRLRRWADAPRNGRPTHRALSIDEVKELARQELFDIGAHTVSHQPLSVIPIARQQREIQQSINRLEQILQQPVSSFSYPHGDYTAKTVSLVRRAGLNHACATNPAPVLPSSDRFQLPRCQVMDWDAGTFDWQLTAWLEAND